MGKAKNKLSGRVSQFRPGQILKNLKIPKKQRKFFIFM